MESCIALLLRTQKLGLNNSQEFPSALTREFVNSLDLKACSFYTISSDEQNLILRGQYGFQYDEYISFELPLNTIAGRAFKGSEVLFENNLAESLEYRDKRLVDKYGLVEIIAIPLSIVLDCDMNVERVGVVCLYPKATEKSDLPSYIQILREAVNLAYTHSVERMKMQVREKVVSAISASTDLNSALFRILQKLLRNQISIEAASIYLYDERLRLLRLHATTGIKTEKDLHKHDISFNKRDIGFPTWDSFQGSIVISRSSPNKILGSDKFLETTKSPIKSLLVLPITRTSNDHSSRKTRGVLRVANKLLRHENKYELTSFTKEDVGILSYVCEIIGLTSHMFLNKENRISYFEKIMHGTKSNIQASIQNIDFLERHGKIESFMPKDLLYTVHDTREWLDDIRNQMERLENSQRSELSLETISLTGDVLINTIRLFEKSAQTMDIALARITKLSEGGFFQLPPVKANVRALMTVFRNLVENALKYRNHDKNKCIVKLSHRVDSEYVYIHFTDDGIGIPLGDEHDVFAEGFRSENAVRQDPAGTGLGLTQSKEIMRLMEGDLTLESIEPVTLVVKIKRAEL